MTAPAITASTPVIPPRPRSHLHAHVVLATLTAIGFTALAQAAFVSPLTRLTYNPSDSAAVGWCRIDPLDPRTTSLPRPLSTDSIMLVPLPVTTTVLATQHGYLPMRVPLLKRASAVAPQHVCIVAGQARIDGMPSAAALPADRLGRALPSLRLCRHLEPDELFLLGVTNPTSFDSRYFGSVSASAVIGITRLVWLEARP